MIVVIVSLAQTDRTEQCSESQINTSFKEVLEQNPLSVTAAIRSFLLFFWLQHPQPPCLYVFVVFIISNMHFWHFSLVALQKIKI